MTTIPGVNTTTTSALTGSQTSAQASTGVTPTAKALQKAGERIQAAVDTSTTQLSSFGVLKSAVSNIQLAAHALHSLPSTVSAADLRTAASGFAAVFNNAISTAKATATAIGPGTVTASAVRAGSELGRAVTVNTATLDAMKKIGFSVLRDGTLTLDAKKFDAAQKADPTAVRTTLAKLGQQVDAAAGKELATGGTVASSLTSLNQLASSLKAQQSALLKAGTAATTSSAASASYGLSAYLANA
jgi:flagellar capping protein FliD